MKRKTHAEFVTQVKLALPDVIVAGEYINARTKVSVACQKCGYSWNANPFDLIYGHGCPRCAGKERKTPERFAFEVHSANPGVELIEDYVNASTKILARCRVCGHEWKANPSTLLAGNGCPACAGTRKKTHGEFVEELKKISPDISVLGSYKNNRTKLLVKCKRCGHTWKQTPHNLIDGRSRCPKCTHSSTSFVEQYIIGFMRQIIPPASILERDTNAIGMELDIFIPSLKLAFEPGAWFWHKDKLGTDGEKRIRCQSRGIRLVTIYDKVPPNEMINGRDVYSYSYDLRVEKDKTELQNLLIKITRENFDDEILAKVDWCLVENYAYEHSIKTTTEKYAEKIRRKAINVTVIGEYKSSSSRIRVRCNSCGHEWSPRADALLSGNSSCRKCRQAKSATKHLKEASQYLNEVNSRNPTIEVIGPYQKAASRIHVRCKLCGHEWNPVANSLICKHPSACPRCWGGKRAPK